MVWFDGHTLSVRFSVTLRNHHFKILSNFSFLQLLFWSFALFKLWKLLIVATALSRLPNDKANEMTAAKKAHVRTDATILC